MEPYTRHDRIGLHLSGGASNASPAASLGGLVSSKLVRGMYPQFLTAVQGLVIEDATPECGEGIAKLGIVGDTVFFTPPNGTQGIGVDVTEDQTKIIAAGDDDTKAVRIRREIGEAFSGLCEFYLLDTMNGVLSMGNVPDADRQAGEVYYRAVFVKCYGECQGVAAWVEPPVGAQASFALAQETPTAEAVQAIADEKTAPTGLSWVDAVSEATALDIGDMVEDQLMGLWIRRTIPSASTVSSKETVNFCLRHRGV